MIMTHPWVTLVSHLIPTHSIVLGTFEVWIIHPTTWFQFDHFDLSQTTTSIMLSIAFLIQSVNNRLLVWQIKKIQQFQLLD